MPGRFGFTKRKLNGKYVKRRRNYRRGGKPGGLKTAYWLAKKAYQGYKFVRGIVNAEHLYSDVNAQVTPGTTPAISQLIAIAQGDGEAQRTGNSILAKYIDYNIRIIINASGTADVVRVVMFMDTQQIADTSPSWTDVFDSADPQTNLLVANLGRFSILYDKLVPLTINGREAVVLRGKVPLNHHVRYNGTASTDIQRGGLFFGVVGLDNTNKAQITSRVRLAYYDN